MSKRVFLTENEKLAQNIVAANDGVMSMAGAERIEDIYEREKANKFNEQVDAYADKLAEHTKKLHDTAESVGLNFEAIEIKPMFARILIKPFEQNPFQRIVIDKKTNIVTDTGGLAPEYFNRDKGKNEVMEQMLIVGAIQEVGPEVKYLVPGDVVMYRKETAMPVPFYKQGLVCIAESQVVAVINEGLEARFEEIKKNGN